MKHFILILITASFIIGCEPKTTETTQAVEGRYGDTTWTADQVLSPTNFVDALQGKDSLLAQVSGTISSACQAKGCWMKMDVEGTDMLVRFKDYGFFVPMNSAGYKATLQGMAFIDTLSVADQIELAKDAELGEEAIAQIVEPKMKLTFMANGVIIE